MKKVFSIFIAVFLICCSCAVAASAANADWMVSDDLSTLTHGDEEYVRLYNDGFTLKSDGHWSEVTGSNTNRLGFEVCVFEDADYIVKLSWHSATGGDYQDYYCLESHAEELKKLAQYDAENYSVSSASTNEYVSLDFAKMQDWLQNGERLTVTGDNLPGHEYSLYSSDSDGKVFYKTGLLIRDFEDDNKYYIIKYADYDRTYFYYDGSLALEGNIQIKLYAQTDAELAQYISSQIDYTGDDELDWLVTTSVSRGVIAVSSVLLFAVLPLVLIVLCAVFLMRKVRKPYNVCLWVLLSLSAITVISYAIVFTSLL